MGARRRNLVRYPQWANVPRREQKLSSNPIGKGAMGCEFTSAPKSNAWKNDLTHGCRDKGTGNAFKLRCGSTGTGERTVARSILAELLKILVHSNGNRYKTKCERSPYMFSSDHKALRVIRSPCVSLYSLLCMLHSPHQSHGTERKEQWEHQLSDAIL